MASELGVLTLSRDEADWGYRDVKGNAGLVRALILILALLMTAACEESPTGRKQVTLVPDAQMAEIGERTFTEMLRSQPVVTDRRILDYVGCVGRALVDALPEPQGTWSVAIFQDPPQRIRPARRQDRGQHRDA